MKKANTLMAVIVVMLGLTVPAVYAQGAETCPKQGKQFMAKSDARMQKLYDELKLTDAQKKQLEENKSKRAEQTKGLFKQMHEKMMLVREELQKDNLDMDKIHQANDEVKKLQAQMADDRLEGILEVRKILTGRKIL